MIDAQPQVDPDASIFDKMDRIHEIVDIFEAGDLSLERAKQLREEGRELLATLEIAV